MDEASKDLQMALSLSQHFWGGGGGGGVWDVEMITVVPTVFIDIEYLWSFRL